jgi:hypothetical protein
VRLVRLCGGSVLPPDQLGQLAELGASLGPADWQETERFALAQGVAPLVFQHTAQAGLLPAMPAQVAAQLADHYRETLVGNRRIQQAQETLLAGLAAKGIEAMPVKGITLALRYYGGIGLRPAADLDLLVRRRDRHAADQTLRRLGYCPMPRYGRVFEFKSLTLANLVYERDRGPVVELHWELVHNPVYRAGLSVAEVWKRSQVVDLGGRSTRCLSVDDELRFLSVHCMVDHFPTIRLIWLVDIAELVRGLPATWDWSHFVEETAAARLATPVVLALTRCQAFLGLELPPGAVEGLIEAARRPEDQAVWTEAQTEHYSIGITRAHLAALGSTAEKVVFLGNILLRRLYRRPGVRRLVLPLRTAWHQAWAAKRETADRPTA